MQNTFEEFIKEKTVSLVGPASYMMGSDHGEQIDSDDVVIRINRSYESVDVFSSDIGKRTDILYSCLIEKNANAGMLDRDVLVSKGVPQEVIEESKKKMRAINSAFDKIEKMQLK